MLTKLIRTAVLIVLIGFLRVFPQSASNPDNSVGIPQGDRRSTPAEIGSVFFITSDGARIHYLTAGKMTNEPPIVFIPGFTLSATLWERQLREFSSNRLTIAIDPRSQGESSIMQYGNTPERRAMDLHELVTNLDIARFVIVGWSQGAQDVAAYLGQYGTDSLAGIVFVDSVVSGGPNGIEARKSFRHILSRLAMIDSHPAEYSEGLVRSIFSRPHPELDMKYLIDESRKTPPSIEIAMLVMDVFGADRRPALKKIDRPTLVISSASSDLTEQKEMANTIPGALWVVVADAGHALFVDNPEKFDVELTRLLKAVSR